MAPRTPLRTSSRLASWLALPVVALGTLCAAPAIAQEGPPPGRALVIQESNGFPGGEQSTELSRQTISIIGGRLRVLDPAHGWALFVSLPDRTVREASIARREYVERGFDYYDRYRQDRAKALRDQAAEFTRQRQRLQGKTNELRALEQEYTQIGGDPRDPGNIVARVEHFPQDERKATILVDREPREVTLEHYRIRENNAQDPVFDLWITRDLKLPVDVLAFWRALGTFAPEVSERLAAIPGVVIECTAVLDTGTFKRRFQSRVLELRTDDPMLEDAAVALPATFAKVDPADQAAAQAAAAPRVWCVMTGRMIEPGEEVVFIAPNRRRYHVVDAQQRAALIRLLGEGKQPPFLDAPAASQGQR
ncbi:MAG: hypothetical protein M9894_26385 [Planctomycetes bacterium]|nr:hypothetical protein [Planctomycetota bacterium]